MAAHRTLPFQTMVRVRNLTNDKTVWPCGSSTGPVCHRPDLLTLHAAACAAIGNDGLVLVSVMAFISRSRRACPVCQAGIPGNAPMPTAQQRMTTEHTAHVVC